MAATRRILNKNGKKGSDLVPRIASQALAEEWWVSLYPQAYRTHKTFYYLC